MMSQKLLQCLHLVDAATVDKGVPINELKRRECIPEVLKKDIISLETIVILVLNYYDFKSAKNCSLITIDISRENGVQVVYGVCY